MTDDLLEPLERRVADAWEKYLGTVEKLLDPNADHEGLPTWQQMAEMRKFFEGNQVTLRFIVERTQERKGPKGRLRSMPFGPDERAG